MIAKLPGVSVGPDVLGSALHGLPAGVNRVDVGGDVLREAVELRGAEPDVGDRPLVRSTVVVPHVRHPSAGHV